MAQSRPGAGTANQHTNRGGVPAFYLKCARPSRMRSQLTRPASPARELAGKSRPGRSHAMKSLSARERYNISRIAIAFPWLTVVFWVGVAVTGIFAFRTLRYSLLPDITFPVVVVNAGGPMTDAAETADQLSRPIEARLKTLENLNEVRASIYPGRVAVTLSFKVGTNLERSARQVEANLKSLKLTTGVSKAETNGNNAVSPAASARSPRAIFVKIGTTGAKGDAASRAIRAAMSAGSSNKRAARIVSAGTSRKFAGRTQPRWLVRRA